MYFLQGCATISRLMNEPKSRFVTRFGVLRLIVVVMGACGCTPAHSAGNEQSSVPPSSESASPATKGAPCEPGSAECASATSSHDVGPIVPPRGLTTCDGAQPSACPDGQLCTEAFGGQACAIVLPDARTLSNPELDGKLVVVETARFDLVGGFLKSARRCMRLRAHLMLESEQGHVVVFSAKNGRFNELACEGDSCTPHRCDLDETLDYRLTGYVHQAAAHEKAARFELLRAEPIERRRSGLRPARPTHSVGQQYRGPFDPFTQPADAAEDTQRNAKGVAAVEEHSSLSKSGRRSHVTPSSERQALRSSSSTTQESTIVRKVPSSQS